MLKSILIATDFSERSTQALSRAAQLAKKHHATLHLVHIIDDDQPVRIVNAQKEVATHTLEDMAKEISEAKGIKCIGLIKTGTPHITLCKACTELGANLLVLGPHRKHFLKDAFVGTTAERTIKYATCPVLVVNQPPATPYNKALLATDFSEGAAKAANTFKNLKMVALEKVVLYHAFSVDEPIETNFALALDNAEKQIEQFAEAQKLDVCKRYGEALERSIPMQILLAAENESADLIVIGARGQSGSTAEFLEQAFFGSVAKEVVSATKTDVLITR